MSAATPDRQPDEERLAGIEARAADAALTYSERQSQRVLREDVPWMVARLRESQAEVERLRMVEQSQRGALTLVLTEHRIWVETVEAAIAQADGIEPHGSDEWVASGKSMRTTVLRVIRDAVARVDAPTIEARAESAERERDRLHEQAARDRQIADELRAQVAAVTEALNRVRTLHRKVENPRYGWLGPEFICGGHGPVSAGYPCATIRALADVSTADGTDTDATPEATTQPDESREGGQS